MKAWIALLAVGCALAIANSKAGATSAGGWVNVTKCDSISIQGGQYPQLTFEIHNQYPIPEYPVCSFLLVPETTSSPDDSCRAIASAGPTGWNTAVASGHVVWILNDGNQSCISQGGVVGNFQVVLSKAQDCCYEIRFYGNLPEYFAQDIICFTCDRATPAQSHTWGQLKAFYRG